MKIHKFDNIDFKGNYATFELEELITKVVVTPETPSLAWLSSYSIEAEVNSRKN